MTKINDIVRFLYAPSINVLIPNGLNIQYYSEEFLWNKWIKSSNGYLTFCMYHFVTLLWRQHIHNLVLLQRRIYCIPTWTSSVLVVIWRCKRKDKSYLISYAFTSYSPIHLFHILIISMTLIHLWFCNYILLNYFHFKDNEMIDSIIHGVSGFL